MGGKSEVDPATVHRIKYPSDIKKRARSKRERKPRTTEQNAARRKKEMDGGEFRPNKNTEVYF